MDTKIRDRVLKLYETWAGEPCDDILPVGASGSYRKYFRMKSANNMALGAYYDNVNENRAFIGMSRHFKSKGLNVPGIFAVSRDTKVYLQEYLGDANLYDLVVALREEGGFGQKLTTIYKRVIDELVKFQMVAGPSVDYSLCYPAAAFDRQAYLWDLNYFKYNFLKLAGIVFDEYRLEKDFEKLTEMLLSADHSYFVYRDFQARNIMLKDEEPWFIDFQGGRKGPLHYDPASLLFQAGARLPFDLRERLTDHYIERAGKVNKAAVADFREHFYRFVLIRILQTFGAYGFRGLYERKPHFLRSISPAMENVIWLMENEKVPDDLPEIKKCLEQMIAMNEKEEFSPVSLKVRINSFSYKRGIPVDLTGNGGGFVFDCRGLPNPGRLETYRDLTGKDAEVKSYLQKYPEVRDFVEEAAGMVSRSISVYLQRNFTDLMVNFGCTGGQHRSVYCAQQLALKLDGIKGIEIIVRHYELEKKIQSPS